MLHISTTPFDAHTGTPSSHPSEATLSDYGKYLHDLFILCELISSNFHAYSIFKVT